MFWATFDAHLMVQKMKIMKDKKIFFALGIFLYNIVNAHDLDMNHDTTLLDTILGGSHLSVVLYLLLLLVAILGVVLGIHSIVKCKNYIYEIKPISFQLLPWIALLAVLIGLAETIQSISEILWSTTYHTSGPSCGYASYMAAIFPQQFTITIWALYSAMLNIIFYIISLVIRSNKNNP